MILSNLATLRLKGLSRTDASLEIAQQWRDGNGSWFARRIHALARHYQIFEQLPGRFVDIGQYLIVKSVLGLVQISLSSNIEVKFCGRKKSGTGNLRFMSCRGYPTVHHRSYRFMSAYRIGLTGKAAEWAVCK